MTRWAAFVGLTGVVLTLFLGLARLSQGAVREPPSDDDEADSAAAVTAEVTPVDGTEPAPSGSPDDRPDSRRNGAEPAPCGTDADRRAELPPGRQDPEPHSEAPPWEAASGPESGELPSLSTGALLANVAVTQALFGGILAAGALYFSVPASALGIGGETPLLLAVGVVLGVALWLGNEAAAALADAAGATYDENLRELLAPASAVGWVALFALVLPVVALVEEFVFRAAVVGVPVAGFGVPAWPLVLVSAGVFALGHGAQGRLGIAVTGGLGLALAVAYVLTGSLLVVVVAHYLVNALEFGVHELLGVGRLPG